MSKAEDLGLEVIKQRDERWTESRLKALAPRPGKHRATLKRLVDKPRNEYDYDAVERRKSDTIRYFDSLTDAKRHTLWERLFPQFAKHLERAWTDAALRPYQVGYERLPFRAPSRSATAGETRARFFLTICDRLRGYDKDAEWLAAWAPHVARNWDNSALAIGWLLSAVLRNGGPDADRVRDILYASMTCEHEIGAMGQHIVVALLNSDASEDWEAIGKLLLAAQRQEGLRQSILETVDEAHPDAFRYMLGLILEHNLGRFSATVRAFDVWLGLQWAGGSVKSVQDGVARLCEFFDDQQARQSAIESGEAEAAYLALWTIAYRDAEAALTTAVPLLEDSDPQRRFIALKTLDHIGLFPETLNLVAERFVSGNEDDTRLQMACVDFLTRVSYDGVSEPLFKAAADLFEATPSRKKKLDPLVWPWVQYTADRRAVAAALRAMTVGEPERLIPFAKSLDSSDCARVIRKLAGIKFDPYGRPLRQRKRVKLSPAARSLIVQLTCDSRQYVQEAAFEALERQPVKEDEVELLLANLHRSAAALRKGAIERLAKLPDRRVLEIVETLLSDKHEKKRAAGLELAEHLVETGRSAPKVRAIVANYLDALAQLNLRETAERIIGGLDEALSQDDCFGLVSAGSRCKPITPKFAGVHLETKAAKKCLRELAELLLEHGETEIELKHGYLSEEGKRYATLSSAGWGFPTPDLANLTQEDAQKRLPLSDIWLEWLDKRPTATRDDDGLELVRAWAWSERGWSYADHLPKPFRKFNWDLIHPYQAVLRWMAFLSEPIAAGALFVQYFEDTLVKENLTAEEKKDRGRGTYDRKSPVEKRLDLVTNAQDELKPLFTNADAARLGALALLAYDRTDIKCHERPTVENFVAAYDAGLVNDRDLVWVMLSPREFDQEDPSYRYYRAWNYSEIQELTGLKPHPALAGRDSLLAAVTEVRDRLVKIEVKRGERSSPATLPASQIRRAGGAGVLFDLTTALGRDTLVRMGYWGELTRGYSLSRLIYLTSPSADDTHEQFRERCKASGLSERRLIEIAVFAPQWAAHLEFTLKWTGLEDAVWWIHAHTKSADNWHDDGFRAVWEAQINERTALTGEELEEGAVDVAWFNRVIETIGEEGWAKLDKPAKFASNSGGHKRATLFASAMLGRVKVDDLRKRIDDKRHQDSVRALGLIPLPKRQAARKKELLSRYARLNEFKRESQKFGSQRQASEGLAVDVGMQNLARTAGYADPRRLQWAMEAEFVSDLAKGPVTVTKDEVSVSLAVTPEGDSELTVVKKGKPLKNVPAKLRKHEPIAKLRSRVTDLRRQRARMRTSFEESMCRGSKFDGNELKEFLKHPILRPMIERLVFFGDGNLVGYPDEAGRVLREHSGRLEPIGKSDAIRLAHPVDLFARGDWSEWQRECFRAERTQPFKQIFRELYTKTAAERDNSDMTRRYAGHQVNPRQALSLLKGRQWIHSPDEGVRRVFREQRIVADLWFQEHFYSPADVEGLTLEGVGFAGLGRGGKRIVISDVPDRVFSEAMRDIDLVVSVAHAGGVDPEASASTVEMRAALLHETFQVLGLNNVRVENHHAFIDGSLARYTVHLGSATTKIIPGRDLLIVAVHSQYRGRLFLPFADDDPKTAEVLAKTLLLARDDEIADPRILDQIRE